MWNQNFTIVVLGQVASILGNAVQRFCLSVYAPYYIKIYLGLSTELYGIIEGAAVSGMVLSGFLLALFPRRFRTDNLRAVMLPMSAILLVAGFSAFLDAPPLQKGVIFALCCLVMMFAVGVSNVVTLSHTQKVAPPDMLGRVSAPRSLSPPDRSPTARH
jgi:hypothetical protein